MDVIFKDKDTFQQEFQIVPVELVLVKNVV